MISTLPSSPQRDPKGSAVRGMLRLTADAAAGASTALPGETPLEHARRVQAVALGQEPADTLPERMGRAIENFRGLMAARPRRVSRGSTEYTGATVAADFRGIGVPADARNRMPAKPHHDHPCPECGDGMTWEPRQTTDGPNGIGIAELAPAGWWCDCGHFEHDDKAPRVSHRRP